MEQLIDAYIKLVLCSESDAQQQPSIQRLLQDDDYCDLMRALGEDGLAEANKRCQAIVTSPVVPLAGASHLADWLPAPAPRQRVSACFW